MPEPQADARTTVAVFDVDGTLTTRDCVVPFLRRAAPLRLPLTLLRHPVTAVRASLHHDHDRLKELSTQALRGRSAADLDEAGADFAREIRARLLRADTVRRLQRHRELGHTVVLASASYVFYLRPLAAALGADELICTLVEIGPDGRLTGRLDGGNCRGAEKARRVRAWLDGAGLGDAELWAYSDSRTDAPLLELAEHPVWVGGVTIGAEPA